MWAKLPLLSSGCIFKSIDEDAWWGACTICLKKKKIKKNKY